MPNSEGVDAAGNAILSGQPVVVVSGSALRRAVIHRAAAGGWMLVYDDTGEVAFLDHAGAKRTVARIPS